MRGRPLYTRAKDAAPFRPKETKMANRILLCVLARIETVGPRARGINAFSPGGQLRGGSHNSGSSCVFASARACSAKLFANCARAREEFSASSAFADTVCSLANRERSLGCNVVRASYCERARRLADSSAPLRFALACYLLHRNFPHNNTTALHRRTIVANFCNSSGPRTFPLPTMPTSLANLTELVSLNSFCHQFHPY